MYSPDRTAAAVPGVTSTGVRRPADELVNRGTVLVVDDDEMILCLVAEGLTRDGYRVSTAMSGVEALLSLDEVTPDLVISDVNMPAMDGFSLITALRAHEDLRHVPLIFLTSRSEPADVVTGLTLGADDYVVKPFDLDVLLARVHAKVSRPPVPVDRLSVDSRSGLVGAAAISNIAGRERDRAQRSGREGYVAVLDLDELASIRLRFGARAVDGLTRQLGEVLSAEVGPLEVAGRDEQGRFILVLPEVSQEQVQNRLQALGERVAHSGLQANGETVHVSPVVGYARLTSGASATEAIGHAALAREGARVHLDLRPVAFTPAMLEVAEHTAGGRGRLRRGASVLRAPAQILTTLVLGLVLPYLLYWRAWKAGFDISGAAYVVVVVSLLITGATIWVEGFLAQHPTQPRLRYDDPEAAARPHPTASALIAAYLPNEAATIIETVEAFQRLDYPGELQIVVAYNTPRDLPVEQALGRIALQDPRLTVLRVAGSSSKAQNVNAALAVCTGEMIGVFDADHHPDPESFRRAWRWLDEGYDVVQGHPVVRNADSSWVARMIAVEFEMIYAVSHPGRARLHGFGIFGGSNGYWRADLLRKTRMRGSMLTEDIDSSLRVVEAGYLIASDPYLVSRELAPTTLPALWNQRMRWAQGWFQVSLGHLRAGWRSPHLSLRQKAGFTFLLGWREVYPWLSFQMFPLIAFYAVRAHGVGKLDWFVPVFVLTSLFTLTVGPWQTLFAYRQAHPSIKQHKRWFLTYLVTSSLFYTEYKNVIARVAQVKQAVREKTWKVTPRTAGTASEVPGAQVLTTADISVNDPINHDAAAEDLSLLSEAQR